jgi:hypothetical protein
LAVKLLVLKNNIMLRINIPSNGPSNISFATFDNYDFPKPPNGMDSEVNNDVILLFDDEQEAVDYARELKRLAFEIDDERSAQKKAANEVATAIESDEFVREYLG